MKIEDLKKLKVCWEIPYHKTWELYKERDKTIQECGMTEEVKLRGGPQSQKATFLYITIEKPPQVGVVTYQRKITPKSERKRQGAHKYTHWETDDVLENSGISPTRLQICQNKNPEKYRSDLCDYLVAEIKQKVETNL